MKSIIKYSTVLLGILCFITTSFAQEQWIGKLSLSSMNCETQRVCYAIEIKGVSDEPWALGDQNYRLFYDGDHVSVNSVYSLLPTGTYSTAQTDEILEIYGQGQESYSPLDNIDDNLGFIDFFIISYAKQNPAESVQINSGAFTPVAKICVDVSNEMLEEGTENGMHIYFSQESSAGQITNQYTIVTETDAANHTTGTEPIGFLDITYNSGNDGQLWTWCTTSATGDIDVSDIYNNSQVEKLQLFPNPVETGGFLNYEITDLTPQQHDITIYDLSYKVVDTFTDLPSSNKKINLQSNLPTGVYILKLNTNEYQLIKEFVVIN